MVLELYDDWTIGIPMIEELLNNDDFMKKIYDTMPENIVRAYADIQINNDQYYFRRCLFICFYLVE